MQTIVGAFMTSRHGLAVAREDCGTTIMRSLPGPDVVPGREGLSRCIALTVKEVALKLARLSIETEDLNSANPDRVEAAIDRVHHEIFAG
jgi:hypothetical protein